MLLLLHHPQVAATGAADLLVAASREWVAAAEVLEDGEHTMRMIVE